MSSLKMTFSLASLVLILGLVFVTAPAMAQIDQLLYFGTSGDSNAPDDSTDDVEIVSAATIPANGHLVIRKAASADAAGLPATVFTGGSVLWENMPDLEELFFGNAGGTIALKATETSLNAADPPVPLLDANGNNTNFRLVDHDNDDPDNNNFKADGTTAATPDRDIEVNDFAITEVMWGLDNAVAGSGDENNRQWIEIHNRTKAAVTITGMILHIKSGRPGADQISKADVPADLTDADPAVITIQGRTVLDWFSNVDGNGWQNTPPGQSGFTTDAANIDNRIDFVSMYRNRGKLGKTEGTNLGYWIASTNTYLAGYKGTPGASERTGPKRFSASGVSLDIVFNEVANHSEADYEWFELLNPDGELPHLENWTIRIVTGVDNQDVFLRFPKLNDGRYGNLLLVTKTDPATTANHPLAAGYNVAKDDAGQLPGHDPTIRYYVAGDRWEKEMPDGEFILILRNHKDKTDHDNVVDVAGYVANLKESTADFESSLWPLRGHGAPASNKNQFMTNTVHRRQHAGILGTGTTHGDKKDDQVAMRGVGWTGIGYKRNANSDSTIGGTNDGNALGGTPGYPNNALRGNNDADAIAAITISEVMAIAGERSLPEWIELQNISNPIGVNFGGWRVLIVNHDSDGDGGSFAGKLTHTIQLSGTLPAGQNYLIVARRGRDETNLPNGRVNASLGLKRGEPMLNPYGFQITVEAKKDSNYFHVDTIGNLGPAPEKSRRADAQSFEPLAWELPAQMNEEGDRISLVRASGADDGTEEGALIRFDMSNQIDTILDPTSYGHATDLSSPGHHPGGVLPVSLSKFRPERMKDTGAVVVRWITESETNNAGFNILRSDTRDGEFTKLNTKLIAGHGTTSERNTYEYADTSAKPNVIYYYQIQDVSLDGQVQTLRTTHLRGNVTAAGKLTTTWAELKALQ